MKQNEREDSDTCYFKVPCKQLFITCESEVPLQAAAYIVHPHEAECEEPQQWKQCIFVHFTVQPLEPSDKTDTKHDYCEDTGRKVEGGAIIHASSVSVPTTTPCVVAKLA